MEEALQQLEASRAELTEALTKEKELNELKSRFVAMASHEFRTPLAAISSSLSLVSKYAELGNAEKQQHHIQRIKNSVTNMTELLNDVLSLSKLEEGKVEIQREQFLLQEFAESVLQELHGLLKKEQTILYKHEGDAAAFTDKKVVRIILFNLVSNAIKFSTEEKVISLSTSIKNGVFVITVQDQGIGISEEDKEHLFERFFRGKNVTNIQGTGLGLSIILRYVELLQGTVDVQSELQQGTTISIQIPNA